MTDLKAERFTMAPVSLIGLMRDGAIKPGAYALWHVLWSFTDSEKRECWPSRGVLAGELGLNREASVDPLLKQLVNAGVLEIFRRGGNGKQYTNGYRVIVPGAQPSELYGKADSNSTVNRIGAVRKTVDEQEPKNNNQIPKTTISPKPTVSERLTQEDEQMMSIDEDAILNNNHPVLLPYDWEPNHTHEQLMFEKLPNDHPDYVVAAFADMHEGHHSSDWDKKFSWWLNHVTTDEHAHSAFRDVLDRLGHSGTTMALQPV